MRYGSAHALPHPFATAGCGHHRQGGPGDWMALMHGGRHGRWRGAGGQGGAGWGFGGPGCGRGPRARRGDVRAALLVLLEEEPRNGYQLMQEIEERSGGAWRPSSGAVYPALQQLEDEGLVRAEEAGGRRTFALTDEGRAYVEEHRERLAAPWDAVTEAAGGGLELRALMGQLAAAVFQVAQAGSDEQIAEAKRILVEARRALYRLLAD